MSEHLGRRVRRGEVDRLDRVVVEAVELPLVGQRLGAVLGAARPGRGQVTHVGFGPGRRIVERAHQLPEVVAAAVGSVDTHDDALEVGADVGRHLDA